MLLANIASMYAVYRRPQGEDIAERTHALTAILAQGLKQLGVRREQCCIFDTLTLTQVDTAALRSSTRTRN